MNCDFKKVLVTGGAGFIGSHLVDALVDIGCQVTVLDNLSTGKSVNLEHPQGRITSLRGDIQDPEALIEAMAGCDGLIHTAAMVSIDKRDAQRVRDTNVGGTQQVIGRACDAGVGKIVHVSSVWLSSTS